MHDKLELRSVSKVFRAVENNTPFTALRDINLRVAGREFLGGCRRLTPGVSWAHLARAGSRSRGRAQTAVWSFRSISCFPGSRSRGMLGSDSATRACRNESGRK